MRISDWSSDVCSSDLNANAIIEEELATYLRGRNDAIWACTLATDGTANKPHILGELDAGQMNTIQLIAAHHPISAPDLAKLRSEEHTSELQSLMRNSYAVFCLKKQKQAILYVYTIPYTRTRKEELK